NGIEKPRRAQLAKLRASELAETRNFERRLRVLTPILRIFCFDLDKTSQKPGHWHGWHRHCYSSSHPIPYLVEGASPTPTDIRKPRPLTSASPLLGGNPLGTSASFRLLCRLRRRGSAFEIEIQIVLVSAIAKQ